MTEKQELSSIIGPEWVLDSPEVLQEYSRDHSFTPRRKPDLVVKPKNTEEVQKIVKWANVTSMPLIPVSSGPPHFRGDTIPRMGGVVVDLSRMNKIQRIDRRNTMAYVEPGVTFSQLQPELEKEGMRLPMPLLPRRSKSIVGSFLEREPVTMPRYQWDISDPLRCVEVIFGSGDLMRTGEASGPGTIEEQWKIGGAQIWPEGPHQVDYHRLIQGAQGAMGIVTWASVKCEKFPRLQKLFLVPSEKVESLFEFTYQLLKVGYSDELFILNKVSLANMLGDGTSDVEGRKEELPPWALVFCIAGYERYPEERVAYQEKYITNIAQQFGVEPVSALLGAAGGEVLEALRKPSEEPYWKLKSKGECQDILFLTTLDRTPQFVTVMYDEAGAAGYPTSNIGIYLQPIVQGTSCHCEFDLPYDPANSREADMVYHLLISASQALMKKGAFFSRPYGPWSDMVYSQSTEYVAALKKVKGIFDPHNVMNPGKLCF